jgi:hypothetical protein
MDTYAIKNEIYPYIKSKYDPTKFKQIMSRFMNKRSTMLYDTCPCDRISFMAEDRDDFFNTFDIDINKVREMLSHTYYWEDAKFRAMAAKDEFTVCVICLVKLLYDTKHGKDLDLACVYLSFSGKFYPSMHYVCFPIAPTQYRYIMEYVVNNKLSSKFDIKKEGSVIKAVNSLTETWLSTYKDEIKEFSDEDVAYIILQLRDRIKAMLKNVASMYYDAFEKREYITYDTDSDDEDNFHRADSKTLQINQTSQKVISNMTTKNVDYRLCKYVSNSDVKTDEIKSIMESILDNKQNLPMIEELIGILLTEYLDTYPNGRASDIRFVSFSNTAKPNSKNPNIARQKEILEIFLSENSPAYNKRKSRIATKNSYNRAILSYFILYTHNCSR